MSDDRPEGRPEQDDTHLAAGLQTRSITAAEAAALPVGAVLVQDEDLYLKVSLDDLDRYHMGVPPETKTA